MNEHLTIIAPASTIAEYRNLAGVWPAGVGMFLTPLVQDSDTSTVTHYISSGAIDADIAALLNDPAAFVEEINALTGGSMTESEAQSLRDNMELVPLPESGEPDAETVNETLNRLGLQRQPVETEL